MVVTSDHSTFGGSTAEQWGKCPGSVIFKQQVGIQSASEYADEGTIAHGVAERILAGWEPPKHIDPNMVRHARAYAAGLDTYKTLYGALGIHAEKKVISRVYPDVGGTVDALIDGRRARRLIVGDYKYGAGVPVHATNNEQLLFYAALGLEWLLPETDGLFHGEVTLAIFQPRGPEPGWKEWEVTGKEVFDFKNIIYERVEAIKQGDVSLSAGKWCRWCEAKAVCPAYFGEYIEPLLPRTPVEQLSNAQIHDLYKMAPELSRYVKSLEAYIKNQCAAFGSFESYTIAKGKGKTNFLNPIQVEAEYPFEKYPGMYDVSLRTPKQILDMYPELKENMEGQYRQATYDKLITNDSPDYDVTYDDE